MKSYIVALLVVVGVLGGFYGGYRVGQNNVSASTNNSSQFSRTGGTGSFTGGRGGGGFAALCPSPGAPTPAAGTQAVARGSITDLASGSMTLTSTACDVKVTFGPTVTIQKQSAGSTSDLQDNQTVTITGTRQADGSIKATTIAIGGAVLRVGGGASPGTGG